MLSAGTTNTGCPPLERWRRRLGSLPAGRCRTMAGAEVVKQWEQRQRVPMQRAAGHSACAATPLCKLVEATRAARDSSWLRMMVALLASAEQGRSEWGSKQGWVVGGARSCHVIAAD